MHHRQGILCGHKETRGGHYHGRRLAARRRPHLEVLDRQEVAGPHGDVVAAPVEGGRASALAALELADKAGEAVGQITELEGKIVANEADHQSRFDLALAYYASSRTEDAIDHLLTIVQKSRAWNDEAARKQLIEIFDAVGATDPLVDDSRRRLSTILFS